MVVAGGDATAACVFEPDDDNKWEILKKKTARSST